MSTQREVVRLDQGVLRERLRSRGLRWTPQRRVLLEALAEADGHVTGAELVERCRSLDPATTPSTVYRTLDVLEELGVVQHCHGLGGREEFHVRPEEEHGHVFCRGCGASWDIDAELAAPILDRLRERRFAADLSHVTVVGLCAGCQGAGRAT